MIWWRRHRRLWPRWNELRLPEFCPIKNSFVTNFIICYILRQKIKIMSFVIIPYFSWTKCKWRNCRPTIGLLRPTVSGQCTHSKVINLGLLSYIHLFDCMCQLIWWIFLQKSRVTLITCMFRPTVPVTSAELEPSFNWGYIISMGVENALRLGQTAGQPL